MTRPLRRDVLLAVASAASANALLFTLARGVGALPPRVVVPRTGEPIGLGAVVSLTVAGVLAGAAVWALLRRVAPHRAVWLFRGVALLVLALLAYPPLALQDAPPSAVLTLEVLHVVAGACTFWALTGARRRTGSVSDRRE